MSTTPSNTDDIDAILVHDPECPTNITDDYKMCECVCRGEKKQLETLISTKIVAELERLFNDPLFFREAGKSQALTHGQLEFMKRLSDRIAELKKGEILNG